jgi:hypothetical protein
LQHRVWLGRQLQQPWPLRPGRLVRLFRGVGRRTLQFPGGGGHTCNFRRPHAFHALARTHARPMDPVWQWWQHRPAQDIRAVGRRYGRGQHAAAASVDAATV